MSIMCHYSLGSHIIKRSEIIFERLRGKSISEIGRDLGVSRKTAHKWNLRIQTFLTEKWNDLWSINEKVKALITNLSDAYRCGRNLLYKEEACCKIMALALRPPEDFNRTISHWSLTELTAEVKKQGISKKISRSTIGRILQNADIRPHKSRYWLTPKIEDEELFEKQVLAICEVYKETSKREDTVVYSVDEKTGIQALEYINPTKTVLPGSPEKREFEYQRHGTLCLTPSFNVATGKIDEFMISETRDEQDFRNHISHTLSQKILEDKNVVFVTDQLNTHKSEALVRLVAEVCNIEDELGEKGTHGILKSMKSRMAFLEDVNHKVRFVYTPKHCSWLNQVEIWFGILSRKLLKRYSFSSKKALEEKVKGFIKYFNKYLAKPYRWTYEGKALKK